jgi:hypothetical protein
MVTDDLHPRRALCRTQECHEGVVAGAVVDEQKPPVLETSARIRSRRWSKNGSPAASL